MTATPLTDAAAQELTINNPRKALLDVSRQLERDLAAARADRAALVAALTKIMHARKSVNSPLTNMSRADMRKIAADALDHMQEPTESVDSSTRNGVVGTVNGVVGQSPCNTLHINADGSQWWVERPHATGSDIGPAHYAKQPLSEAEIAQQIEFYRRAGFRIDDARATLAQVRS